MNASRSSGVAPLMVFFDTVGSSATGVARPFTDLDVRWNFGDTASSGTRPWQNGLRAGSTGRNETQGTVAAHLYEQPGTYVVSVRTGDGGVAGTCSIVVTDPAVVFANDKTACISNSGDFTGCPANAKRLRGLTVPQALALPSTTPVRRILFHRGEAWSVSQTAYVRGSGPGVIGAYGSGDAPRLVVDSSLPVGSPMIGIGLVYASAIADWRLSDLAFEAWGSAINRHDGLAAYTGADQMTVTRTTFTGLNVAMVLSDTVITLRQRAGHSWGPDHIWDQIAFVGNTVRVLAAPDGRLSNGGIFMSAERLYVADNMVASPLNGGHSHNARFPYVAKAVIANNSFQSAKWSQAQIKLHAPDWGSDTAAARAAGGGYSRWISIQENRLTGTQNAWMMSVGAAQDNADQRVADIRIERNLLNYGTGTQAGVEISSVTNAAVRNNIIDGRAGTWVSGILLNRRGSTDLAKSPVGIDVANNTIVGGGNNVQYFGVVASPLVRDVRIRENLFYTSVCHWASSVQTTSGVTTSNNSADPCVDPLFVGGTTITAWTPRSGSYAVGAGLTGQARPQTATDILGNERASTVAGDIGAFGK